MSGIEQWDTDQVLDFLEDKPFKQEALEHMKNKTEGMVVLHSLFFHGPTARIGLLTVKSNGELTAFLGRRSDFILFLSYLTVQSIITPYQFDYLILQISRI